MELGLKGMEARREERTRLQRTGCRDYRWPRQGDFPGTIPALLEIETRFERGMHAGEDKLVGKSMTEMMGRGSRVEEQRTLFIGETPTCNFIIPRQLARGGHSEIMKAVLLGAMKGRIRIARAGARVPASRVCRANPSAYLSAWHSRPGREDSEHEFGPILTLA